MTNKANSIPMLTAKDKMEMHIKERDQLRLGASRQKVLYSHAMVLTVEIVFTVKPALRKRYRTRK
jgi:hypothetical protein